VVYDLSLIKFDIEEAIRHSNNDVPAPEIKINDFELRCYSDYFNRSCEDLIKLNAT